MISPISFLSLAQEADVVKHDADGATFWLPSQASTFAADVDWVFYFISWLCVVFFVLVMAAMFWFMIKYRSKPGGQPQDSTTHNTSMEIIWTVIPTIIVVFFFWYGYKGYLDMSVPPEDGYEIDVVAQQWSWAFTYPNGYADENLHVPEGVPIRLRLQSEDVLHALFVPAFRVKMDIVPGRYHYAWFQSDNETTEDRYYTLNCAEYCGTGHSQMNRMVVVHAPGKFQEWLDHASDFLDYMAPEDAGKRLAATFGCLGCHSVDGSPLTGPSWLDVYGKMEDLEGGSQVLVDDNYIKDSIINPMSQIVAGMPSSMTSYKGRISDREITAIIAYIQSLSETGRKTLQEAKDAAAKASEQEAEAKKDDPSGELDGEK